MVMAPFTPFLAEELYQKLTGGESVHLLDWPKAGHVNELLIHRMAAARHIITIGLGLRAEKGIKVRQPLSSARLKGHFKDYPPELVEIIREELNLKSVTIDDNQVQPDKSFYDNLKEANFAQVYQIELDFTITPQLKREGMVREVIRFVQNARKNAGLEVDDRIGLTLTTEDKALQQAIKEHAQTIQAETLATTLHTKAGVSAYEENVKLAGAELQISITAV